MIKVEHLVKQYGEFRAVDDLSFTVEKGEILGFLAHKFNDGDTILFSLDKNGELKMSKKRGRSAQPSQEALPTL